MKKLEWVATKTYEVQFRERPRTLTLFIHCYSVDILLRNGFLQAYTRIDTNKITQFSPKPRIASDLVNNERHTVDEKGTRHCQSNTRIQCFCSSCEYIPYIIFTCNRKSGKHLCSEGPLTQKYRSTLCPVGSLLLDVLAREQRLASKTLVCSYRSIAFSFSRHRVDKQLNNVVILFKCKTEIIRNRVFFFLPAQLAQPAKPPATNVVVEGPSHYTVVRR